MRSVLHLQMIVNDRTSETDFHVSWKSPFSPTSLLPSLTVRVGCGGKFSALGVGRCGF